MRFSIVMLIGALASGPALAQTNQAPVDKGPNTPQANAAYQGGGVVLQGAPGAPAPAPQPTPPGQAPKNIVPPAPSPAN